MMSNSPINVSIGKRFRLRRTTMGMSQSVVGQIVGITFQQVQKYESGANAMNPERLVEFARLFGVPVSYFFEEIDLPKALKKSILDQVPDDQVSDREKLEMMKAYSQIASPAIRKKISDLVRAVMETTKDK